MKKTEDLSLVKKMIAKRLGWTLEKLEEEIKNIRGEASNLITERTALLILMDKYGIADPELIERITSEYAVIRIADLVPGMRKVTVLGRIMRLLSEKREKSRIRLLLADGSGKALVYLQDRVAKIFSQLGLDVGDIVLLRRVDVGRKIDDIITLYGGTETELTYVDETDLSYYPGQIVPSVPTPMSVAEARKIISEENVFELDVRGVFDKILDTKEFFKNNRRVILATISLIDEQDPNQNLLISLWGEHAEKVLRGDILPGDILVIRGVSRKKREIRGKEIIELSAGRLSSISVIGQKTMKIREARDAINGKAVFYVIVYSNPSIRKYRRDDKVHRYMFFLVSDDTDRARVLIWDEEKIDELADLKKGDKLRIYGVIRESKLEKFPVEIHVSRFEHILKNPKDFPKFIIEEEIEEKKEEEVKEEIIEVFDKVGEGEHTIIATLKETGEIRKKNGSVLRYAKIRDKKGNQATVFIWNNQLFEKMRKIVAETPIVLRNVRKPRKTKREEIVFFAGDESSVIELKPYYDAKLLRFIKPTGNREKTIGTITEIIYVGNKKFCRECSAPIVEETNGNAICEQGHIGKPLEEFVIVFFLDDDVKKAEVILNEKGTKNLLNELGIPQTGIEKNLILENLQRELEGREAIVIGTVKDAPLGNVDLRIYAEEIILPSFQDLLTIIELGKQLAKG